MLDILRSGEVGAVFFDAVGTLIYPDPPAAAVYAEAGRNYSSRLGQDEVRDRFQTAFRREEAHDRRSGFRTSALRETQRWRRIVAATLTGVADGEACFRELFEHFGRPDAWRLAADVAATLTVLADAGLVLGLASNYDSRLRRVAAGHPALARLPHVIISAEVGWRKPAPQFFAEVCRAVRLPPEQILMVGDDVDNDITGARAAGLQAVLLDREGTAPASGAVHIATLCELAHG